MGGDVLFIDCETAPLTVHTWGLRDLHVGINQIMEHPYLLGFAYSLNGAPAEWVGGWEIDTAQYDEMLNTAHALLDTADVTVGWNSQRFDGPWIEGELMRGGKSRPSPYKHLDLMKVARANFYLPSYKLQYVSQWLGLEGKMDTGGHDLWRRCMAGDEEARQHMAEYCVQDTDLLPPIFEAFRAYFPNTINFALLNGVEELACPACGGQNFQHRGTYHTASMAYPKLWCKDCGKWFREKKNVGNTKGTGV